MLDVFVSAVRKFTGHFPTSDQMKLFPVAVQLSSTSACACDSGQIRIRLTAHFPLVETLRRVYMVGFPAEVAPGNVDYFYTTMVAEEKKGLFRFLSLSTCRSLVSLFPFLLTHKPSLIFLITERWLLLLL